MSADPHGLRGRSRDSSRVVTGMDSARTNSRQTWRVVLYRDLYCLRAAVPGSDVGCSETTQDRVQCIPVLLRGMSSYR